MKKCYFCLFIRQQRNIGCLISLAKHQSSNILNFERSPSLNSTLQHETPGLQFRKQLQLQFAKQILKADV